MDWQERYAGRVLPPEAFEGAALEVARELVEGGVLLCRQVDGEVQRWAVTEAEAYIGSEDRACHAFQRRTPRNEVMFGPPGHWYVYLCYGVHWLLNIVTGPPDFPAAVLIRGASHTYGPGRLTKALAIDGTLNTLPATAESGLWLEYPREAARAPVTATPRIGIDAAGADWALRPYRFVTGSEARKKVRSKWLT
ncbi:MAG: DNA-3-methyladenine glycosylase [Verrucomicrobiota bacterium]